MNYRKILACVIVAPFLSALLSAQAQSSTFDLLYSFTATNGPEFTNIDGADSQAGLVLSGSTLYGTAYNGGGMGNGTVFSVNTDGSALTFSNLHNFSATNGPNSSNGDGANPIAGLLLSGSTLYGTAQNGGMGGSGTVFRLNNDGTHFTNLYNFTANSGSPFFANGDGAYPAAGLVLSGNTLYGATQNGGGGGVGTLFSITTAGSNYFVFHAFSATSGSPDYTNSDGASPGGALILSGGTLYGTTETAGPTGNGTVFSINATTFAFSNLHSFSYTSSAYPYTNNDGAVPLAGLVQSGNTLYGTTYFGGRGGLGTVFRVNTDGTHFTNLYNFSPTNSPSATNTDGGQPVGGLLLAGNTLFGTAGIGGTGGEGTVFSLHTDGSSFSNLYNFAPVSVSPPFTNVGGAAPLGALVFSDTTAYSTTAAGGVAGNGTVFALLNLPVPVSVQPALTIVRAGAQFVITWPTAASNFVLQTTINLASGSWSNITSGITIAGLNYVYTQPFSGQAAFFRLEQGNLTAPPVLTIALVNDKPVISWPAAASNFELQTTPKLSPANWSTITSGIATSGTNFVFTNALGAQSAFFRLEQQ